MSLAPKGPTAASRASAWAGASATVAEALAGLGLLGWVTPWRELASVYPGSIPMAPSTAVALLLLGPTLIFEARRPSSRLTAAVSLLVSLFAFAELATLALGLPAPLDTALVPLPDIFRGAIPTGRMSPLTALGLLFASLGVLFIDLAPSRRVLGAAGATAALAVCLLGGVVTLGYLFGAPLLYGGTVVPMAFSTGLALVCLGLGLVALAPRDSAPLRPFVGTSARAQLLRGFLPVAPALVAVEALIDQVPGLPPALDAALTALLSALIVAAVVSYMAARVARDLERAQADRLQADGRFAQVFHSSLIAVGITEVKSGRIVDVNTRYADFFGYTREEMRGHTVYELGLWADPAERDQFTPTSSARGPGSPREAAFRRKSGELRHALVSMEATTLPGMTAPLLMAALVDVTEHKLLELQLLQSQKLEAIGRLAGGVAHDFNNVLGVILGYGDLLLRQATGAQRGKLEQIVNAAQRAAGLTHQLLAFSRKQVIEPKVLDLNALVSELQKMLERLIGEDVVLAIVPGADLGQIKADRGQLEQVVMNLSVNARDAMPNGGLLRIETANVEVDAGEAARRPPMAYGSYVMLAVADTGCGIENETLSKIFDPFFTTKEPGKGTGLGLATVYGIVKQAAGFVWVDTEVGQGTTFRVYLPRVHAPASPLPAHETPLPSRGSETILLVEDEASLREITREILEEHGYRILAAASGDEAVEIGRRHLDPIHLLLTDVVMPGMNGRQVADSLLAARPSLRVLYMSGYTDDAISHRGVLEPGTLLLVKPFTAHALLQRVREALGGAEGKA